MLWTLDSCGFDINQNCQVEMGTDWTFVQFTRKCPAHQNLPDTQAGFNILWNPQNTGENQRGYNNVEWEMLDGAPTSIFELDQNGQKTFKKGITVTWEWLGTPPDRVLNVHVTGATLTQNQKNSVINKLNNRFGINNVVITYD